MAIGRTFEESLQKALRMTDMSIKGFEPNNFDPDCSEEELNSYLSVASDRRIYAISLALARGYSVDKIHDLTSIDPWFLYKLKRISDMTAILSEYSAETLLRRRCCRPRSRASPTSRSPAAWTPLRRRCAPCGSR